ncbi:MAG: hypothetical protein EZS28_040856 [Streblomastix strix]|uniref:Uncharacterized protein n=1 Tax=Streblomastix strix TaxID=222440 RepID=A0A5J4TZB1_9EUKA|nr:MAG: hypothetical protein EZS28_040856 [Streblomastix strix]
MGGQDVIAEGCPEGHVTVHIGENKIIFLGQGQVTQIRSTGGITITKMNRDLQRVTVGYNLQGRQPGPAQGPAGMVIEGSPNGQAITIVTKDVQIQFQGQGQVNILTRGELILNNIPAQIQIVRI